MGVVSTEWDMHIENSQIPPETKLWLAVIVQVIRSDPPEAARSWLKSRDGQSEAFMAGLDPDWIARKFIPADCFAGRNRRTRNYNPVDDLTLAGSLPLARAHAC